MTSGLSELNSKKSEVIQSFMSLRQGWSLTNGFMDKYSWVSST